MAGKPLFIVDLWLLMMLFVWLTILFLDKISGKVPVLIIFSNH